MTSEVPLRNDEKWLTTFLFNSDIPWIVKAREQLLAFWNWRMLTHPLQTPPQTLNSIHQANADAIVKLLQMKFQKTKAFRIPFDVAEDITLFVDALKRDSWDNGQQVLYMQGSVLRLRPKDEGDSSKLPHNVNWRPQLPVAIFSFLDLGGLRTEIEVECYHEGAWPYVFSLVAEIGRRWVQVEEEVPATVDGRIEKEPKLVQPASLNQDTEEEAQTTHYKQRAREIAKEYWQYLDQEGSKPTQPQLAERMGIGDRSIRYILTKADMPWPPSKP